MANRSMAMQTSISANVNKAAVTTPIQALTCPSDPHSGDPIFTDRSCANPVYNPKVAMGLWYTGSMGPTHNDGCVFCPLPKTSSGGPNSYCCQSWSYGYKSPADNSVGMFGRYPVGRKFDDVTDGLAHSIAVGETLPDQCIYISAYANNFPISGTTIPINTFEVEHQVHQNYHRACGFKSLHPGGAHFLMGDGSVHFFEEFIDYRLFNELGTIAGGETARLVDSETQ